MEIGSGTARQATDLVAYLQSIGLNAEVGDTNPSDEPTKLLVVNDANTMYPETVALLEQTLGIYGPASKDAAAPIQASSQPGQVVGYVIVLGANTPRITPSR